MATEILPVGTTAADSADVQVAIGAPVTVSMKDAEGPNVDPGARVDILLKDDDDKYFKIDQLSRGRPAIVIDGPGTYRFSRPAGPSCGVFSG